jgi:hypothetical protein
LVIVRKRVAQFGREKREKVAQVRGSAKKRLQKERGERQQIESRMPIRSLATQGKLGRMKRPEGGS